MRPIDVMSVAAHYFPEIVDADKMWEFLWDSSPYPFEDDLEKYRDNFERLRKTLDAGLTPCDMCPEPAIPGYPLCIKCNSLLREEEKLALKRIFV